MGSPREHRILKKLEELYPEPASELNFSNEYQLLVSVLLSAQCTDKKVNEVTPALFSRYPDFASLAEASPEALESIIRPINYYRTKAKHLVATASKVVSEYHGDLPHTHDLLTTLPGVGRKTANVVLSELGAAQAIAVDTHVFRVARRLALASGKTVRKVEDELMERFPAKKWRTLHHSLILHGRRVCKAQRPLCEECILKRSCPSSRTVSPSAEGGSENA
jgi:endonuclease III